MEEEEKGYKIKKILQEAVTSAIIIIICVIVLGCVYIVISPNIQFATKTKQEIENSKNNTNIDNAMSKIKEALVKIYSNYIEDVDLDTLVTGAVSGMATSTKDPYTRYVSQEEFDEMKVEGNEEYVGIGVHLTYNVQQSGILILGIMPDSPAYEAGLKAGDVIYYVEDTRTTIENYLDLIDVMKGNEGEKVKLIIGRNKELKEFEVTRKKVKTNNISSEIIDDNIGYIKIFAFENDIYNQFKKEYDNLMSNNIKGLVVDIRNNPGGLVDQTIRIANLFVPKMDALKLVSRYGLIEKYETTSNTEINIPLAIVVNDRSASASEILSGIVQDSKKGVIVGTKTYGKGIVQSTSSLSYGGALSITIAKYYTPSGVEIHKNGITPDIFVELSDEYKNDIIVPFESDIQLQKAIEYINNK